MRDKPSYKEYVCLMRGNIVETRDGRYYTFDPTETWKRTLWIKIPFVVLFLAAFILPLVFDVVPSSYIIMDLVLFNSIFFILSGRLSYNATRFYELAPDSQEVQKAASKKFSRAALTAINTVVCIIALIVFPFSFSGQSLRSAIENNPALQSVVIRAGNGTLYSEKDLNSGTSIVTLSPNQPVHIIVTTVHWPWRAEFALDGDPFDFVLRDTKPSWLLERNYFSQKYSISFNPVQLRDGSVLTLTCGDLVREWVFDVADEEGA